MKLMVNGEGREFTGAAGITEVLEQLGMHPNTALVEWNGRALFRHEWAGVELRDGDKLEIIRVVAGG